MAWHDVGLWRMLTDWFRDPQRRKQVVWRVVESWLPVFVMLWPVLGWRDAAQIGAYIVVVGWLLYEFVLEPLGWAGPYWERGPAEGTTYRYW